MKVKTTVNGLTVIADPEMDVLSKRKVLTSSAIALSTIQDLPFGKCPPVIVTLGKNVMAGLAAGVSGYTRALN